ncbi:CDP-glycerol glycerophosphotransferase family protein [Glaciihabitans sp. GrIS 2.15]|uniref:CDP-glycerol glycerophosphotransferase family protein n=1 Tax=Glaciihabitans sp. GrIS 2.15 TaxID=3071710 RepID=UPI002DF88C3F|nr:CDP-glycerol glycerophosphotransferase [Glaciihabitans sp. GrIS 2.15]
MTAPAPVTVVDTVVVTTGQLPSIVFEGPGEAPAEFRLQASRQVLPAELISLGNRWSARVPLLVSNWNGPLLPARSGRYSVVATASDGSRMSLQKPAELPAPQLLPGVTRVVVTSADGSLVVSLSAPLTDRERGRLQQASLESDYRAAKDEPLNAVFFESFYGQNASCNPLAIDRAIARLRPDVARYWSVTDASVSVPSGATALIEGSSEWWRIRGSARLLVVNDWLRKRLRKRRYQTVLQTWHGTMLKKLALSRVRLGLRSAIATLRERGRWDILLAQNPYSRGIFRRAYAFTGSVWEEGYPRDDVLLTGDAAAVRDRLGISSGVTVLLYAPTWRDDRPDHVDHLDVARFADLLGDEYVTLIRGHSRTLLPGEDVRAPNVLDVTGYPDVSELFLVADALITDYSSVMFDFTVTGKPVYFFTPDLDHYREKLRGFYFDLIPVAPGPVVTTVAELAALVRDRANVRRQFTEKYRAWRERFNPRDDGHAADRVVQRLLAEGLIG